MSERPPPYRRPVLPWERGRSDEWSGARWASAGIEFGVAVVLFFLLGRWLDESQGTAPLWTAVGSLLGVCVGMYMLVRSALRAGAKTDGKAKPPSDGPPSEPPGGPPA
jgi:F0F1-type ATP synthase assembly protein I